MLRPYTTSIDGCFFMPLYSPRFLRKDVNLNCLHVAITYGFDSKVVVGAKSQRYTPVILLSADSFVG